MEAKINTENRLATMEQKIDNLIDDVKDIGKDLKDHIKSESEKYERLDVKYSGKWVEKLTLAIAGGMVIAILTFIINAIK